MVLKYIVLFLLLLNSFTGAAQYPPVFEGMTTDTSFMIMGDLDINLVKYSYSNPQINFLVIHDNEDTGVKAAFQYISENGGSIVDCQYGGVRNYSFTYEDGMYQLDPNSIYTKKGIIAGLEKYGASDPEVVNELERAGKQIVDYYNPEKSGYIFTLHNNGDGSFGIQSYLKGYELESAADSVYINFQMDPDDMMLVTELNMFNFLKKENVNVILQSAHAPDDGSLSIYAMQNNIPYINVEVQHGHIEEHLRLIEIGVRAIQQYIPGPIKKPAN